MSKKPISKDLVPNGRLTVGRRSKVSIAVPLRATEENLRPVLASEIALAKLAGDGGTIEREGEIVLVTGRGYVTREGVIPAEQIFYDRSKKTEDPAHGLGEADKVSWRDEATGYECIILRDSERGHLSGYVGVPRDHPLWGWDCDAVSADLGIDVHGGLTYSAVCQGGPTSRPLLVAEARRICHVPVRPWLLGLVRHATDHRVEDDHAWWFGFSCDHLYDVVPVEANGGARRSMSAETGATYRDDGYVLNEVRNLANQLKAIADGEPVPERSGLPLPPRALDPWGRS